MDRLNEAVLKMTEVPEGSEVIDLGDMSFPLVSYRNIFIFPGIPEYLRNKFSLIKERFRSSCLSISGDSFSMQRNPISRKSLNTVVAESRDVSFGSYPILGNPEYKIIITAESKSEDALCRAVEKLLLRIPGDVIVRIE